MCFMQNRQKCSYEEDKIAKKNVLVEVIRKKKTSNDVVALSYVMLYLVVSSKVKTFWAEKTVTKQFFNPAFVLSHIFAV